MHNAVFRVLQLLRSRFDLVVVMGVVGMVVTDVMMANGGPEFIVAVSTPCVVGDYTACYSI
jgi:hypothetical protein